MYIMMIITITFAFEINVTTHLSTRQRKSSIIVMTYM